MRDEGQGTRNEKRGTRGDGRWTMEEGGIYMYAEVCACN